MQQPKVQMLVSNQQHFIDRHMKMVQNKVADCSAAAAPIAAEL